MHLISALATLAAVTSSTHPTCQICGTAIEDSNPVRCQQCETPHHLDCWEFLGGCSTYACQGMAVLPVPVAPVKKPPALPGRVQSSHSCYDLVPVAPVKKFPALPVEAPVAETLREYLPLDPWRVSEDQIRYYSTDGRKINLKTGETAWEIPTSWVPGLSYDMTSWGLLMGGIVFMAALGTNSILATQAFILGVMMTVGGLVRRYLQGRHGVAWFVRLPDATHELSSAPEAKGDSFASRKTLKLPRIYGSIVLGSVEDPPGIGLFPSGSRRYFLLVISLCLGRPPASPKSRDGRPRYDFRRGMIPPILLPEQGASRESFLQNLQQARRLGREFASFLGVRYEERFAPDEES